MRKYYLLLLLGLPACGPANPATTAAPAAAPQPPAAPRPQLVAADTVQPVGFKALTKDFDTWYRYTYRLVPLGRTFNGLDTDGKPLARKEFLTKLATGKVLALRQPVPQGTRTYRLHAYADPGRNQGIWTTSKQLAEIELDHYRHEGQPLPTFRFVDLSGRAYTPASTQGKVLVLKCWYIGCIACVNEFPALNALAERYQQHPDVLFVSLARDKEDKLRDFLKARETKFAVVPNSWPYMAGVLGLMEYPTHLVVGRDGKVLKVTDRADDLAAALAQAAPLGPPAQSRRAAIGKLGRVVAVR